MYGQLFADHGEQLLEARVALDTRCTIGMAGGPATPAMVLSSLRVHIPMSV
jgi:hypothetical protein